MGEFMKIINETNIERLWIKTLDECRNNVLENVILSGEFDIDEINSEFIKMNKEIATKWQLPVKPAELLINHGEYINKGGKVEQETGINFIIKELKKKNFGNRACYSLINMEDIVESGDNAIPSFMVLQFSFSKEDTNKLLVTAYFRALEVKEFLPINLTEICYNIERIKDNFPYLKKFELNIFAFRAQYIEDFNCLRHSELDIMKATTMVKYLMKDKSKIIQALKDKQRMVESVIINKGIINLYSALEEFDMEDLPNKKEIEHSIKIILDKMDKISIMRSSTSIHENIEKETKELKEFLNDLIKLMEE